MHKVDFWGFSGDCMLEMAGFVAWSFCHQVRHFYYPTPTRILTTESLKNNTPSYQFFSRVATSASQRATRVDHFPMARLIPRYIGDHFPFYTLATSAIRAKSLNWIQRKFFGVGTQTLTLPKREMLILSLVPCTRTCRCS